MAMGVGECRQYTRGSDKNKHPGAHPGTPGCEGADVHRALWSRPHQIWPHMLRFAKQSRGAKSNRGGTFFRPAAEKKWRRGDLHSRLRIESVSPLHA